MDATTKISEPTLRDGSTHYYSLLFADPAARERVIKTLNLVNVISTTLFDVTEPQVAEKKIHWWHEELARMSKRTARHPACVAAQEHLSGQNAVNACLSILSAAANERYTPPASEQDLSDMLTADYNARLFLMSHSLDAQFPATKFDTTAYGLGLMHRLSTLNERLRNGYAVFGDELYNRFNLTPEDLLRKKNDSEALIGAAIDMTYNSMSEAMSALKQSHPEALLPVRILSELRHSQSKLWQKRKPDLLNEYIALTPIRKFFIAYQCKRKYK